MDKTEESLWNLAMIDRLIAIKKLRDALSDLLDLQNGPPLIKYEREWQQAMNQARQVLDDTQGYDDDNNA